VAYLTFSVGAHTVLARAEEDADDEEEGEEEEEEKVEELQHRSSAAF
jgi:hypothetical protein